MPAEMDLLKMPVDMVRRQQTGSDGSTRSPNSSAYSSDTEDTPIRGLSLSQGMPIKSVEGLSIKEEEDISSFDGTSIDEINTAEISRRTSLDERQALSSPGSISPRTSIFSFSARAKCPQQAEKVQQGLKLARLLLTRSKVRVVLITLLY